VAQGRASSMRTTVECTRVVVNPDSIFRQGLAARGIPTAYLAGFEINVVMNDNSI
jgi:hypothetical protein